MRDVDALWGMLIAGEIKFFVSPDLPLHDLSQAKVQLLGTFPLSMIVRAEHPLLKQETWRGEFPLIRSSWSGMLVPPEIQPHIEGSPNIVEDFGTLAGLAACTDAIWLSSAYAIQEELEAGSLVELLRAPQHVEVTLYTLRRRHHTPLANTIAAALRERVEPPVETTSMMVMEDAINGLERPLPAS